MTIIVTGDEPVEEKSTVSFEAGPNGTLRAVDSATKEGISSGAQVDKNTSVLYTATPETGYSVKQWIVNGSVYREQGSVYTGTELLRTVTAAADHVKVEFVKDPEPEPREFTVAFKLGYEGAKDPEPVKVVEGKTVPRPAADPVREGYIFKGWFNGAALYSFDTPVTADLTLTAKWEQVVEPAPQVDKSKLRAAFDECKVLDAKDYTTMTWYPLSAALDRAQLVLKDEDATQPQVDEALKGPAAPPAARAASRP